MSDWRDELEPGYAWPKTRNIIFQIDGQDLVSVNDIDVETGQATITVFASTHPEADIMWQGVVNVREHIDRPYEEDDDE